MEQMMNTMPNMIYPKPQTPVPMPKKKYYWWIIILIVLAAVLIIAFFASQKSAPLTDEQKQEILDQLSQSSTSNLTEQQKIDSLNDLAKNSPQSNLSPEDKLRILDSQSQQ